MAVTGGYDCNFLTDVPDDLLCVICLLPAREAQQTACSCAKLLCFTCLQAVRTCPTCRRPIKAFPDTISSRRIKELKVACPNQPLCQWKNELGYLETHIASCTYVSVSCEKCTEMVLEKQLSAHAENDCPMRKYGCPKCGKTGLYFQIVSTHLEECPNASLPCPNNPGCGETVMRKNMAAHRLKCPKEKISCPYLRGLGYNVTCLKEEIEGKNGINKVQGYLDLAMALIQKRESTTLRVIYECLRYNPKDPYWCSDPFYSKDKGYKLILAIGIIYGGTKELSVQIRLVRNGEYDHMLVWPLTANFKITLLNQLRDGGHHEVTICVDNLYPDSSNALQGTQFISIDRLHLNEAEQCQYLKDGILYFKVEMEPLPPKPWLVSNYSLKKKLTL